MAMDAMQEALEPWREYASMVEPLFHTLVAPSLSELGAVPVVALLRRCVAAMAAVMSSSDVGSDVSIVLQSATDVCHDKLYEGHWRDISLAWRQAYSFCCFLQALRAWRSSDLV